MKTRLRLLIAGALIAALSLIGLAGIVLADPTVTITVTKWNIAPLAPTDFEIEQTALHSINITWTKGTAANMTIVRGSTAGYPFSIFDGDSIYSGNGTYVEVDGLDFDTFTFYYRAWSQNEYGTSTSYAQATIGTADEEEDGGTSTAGIFSFSLGDGFGLLEMMLVIAIMGFAFWKKSWIRVTLSTCLIIWGVFAMPYDIKVAAPLVGIGTVLFVMGTLNLISQSRQSREET